MISTPRPRESGTAFSVTFSRTPLIESLDRLGDLRQPRVYLFAQPLPAAATDAISLRVLAFEG